MRNSKRYLHVCVGDTIRAEIDMVLHTRIVEGKVVELSSLESYSESETVVKVDILSDSYYKYKYRYKPDTFHISQVKAILKRTTTHTVRKMPVSMDKKFFTNKKNVWFGPITGIASAVLKTDYRTQDFKMDYMKFRDLWEKNCFPGLLSSDGYEVSYVKADKFKKWVLQNACKIRRNLSIIRSYYRYQEKEYEQDFYDSIANEYF